MTRRKTFNPEAPDSAPAAAAPATTQYACAAHGCPMPGAIFPEGQRSGVCAWHCGRGPHQWPRITQTLREWGPISQEITLGRAALTGPRAADPKGLQAAFDAAAERVRSAYLAESVDSWLPRTGESYDQWVGRLTKEMGAAVQAALRGLE